MTTPSGQIGFSDVNLELGVSPTSTQANLGSAPFRGLAGVPTGQISMSNLQNKSSFTPISATGGTTIDSGGYRIHVFTSPGSFVVSNAGTDGLVEYLVVAGGGGGGTTGPAGGASGGGAGGFRTATGFSVTATTYPITVGAGAPLCGVNTPSNGSPSVFSTITSQGGGGGIGINGGSGSGGHTGTAFNTDPTGVFGLGNRVTGTTTPAPTQGNNGGAGRNGPNSPGGGSGGGGGGAGGVGTDGNPGTGGPGGIGSPITWLPASYGTPGPAPGRYFAGGGGGGGSPSPGTGGSGGGGNGNPSGSNATTNTGGGGGGGFAGGPGTNGGSGIVVIRYPI